MPDEEWRVLIVDDSPEDRAWLRGALANDDNTKWLCKEAATVRAGLAEAKLERFDCILLDQCLPDRSGLEFIDALKDAAGNLGVAVVMLSGRGDEKLAASAIKSGALDYVSKNDLTDETICRTAHSSVERFRLLAKCHVLEERSRAEADEALRAYRFLADFMPQMVFTCRPDGTREYQNSQLSEYAGLTLEQGWEEVCHPDDLPRNKQDWTHSLTSGKPFETECRLRRQSDGAYRWHLIRVVPFRNSSGQIMQWIGTSTDIHEHKTRKEKLEAEVETRTEMLRRSLLQKETLLQEVHHRVKNNLQVISSLLHMQARSTRDQTTAEALRECQSRVLSMALIYDRLNRTDQIERIDFGEYMRALVDEMFASSELHGGRITSKIEAPPMILSIDQAIPLGLLINELVTNALKHAYPDGASGEVTIELNETLPGRARLRIADQGIGLPQGLERHNSKSLGLSLVEALAKQLGGALEIEPWNGAAFAVEFPTG